MSQLNRSKPDHFTLMTASPIPRLLLRLSVPAVISMMITTIYSMADTAFVGMLGTSQSGATGVVFTYMTILQAFAFLSGQGAGSILSRALGRQDNETASRIATSGFTMSFLLGAAMAVLTFLFMDPLLYMLGSTETILPHARIYVTCIAAAAPFFTASYTMNNLLRYEGLASLGTIGMITGALLNIGLDALLMVVLGWDIAGAGVATAVSQFVSFCILLSMYLRGKTRSKIALRHVSRRFSDYADIAATGSPSLIRNGLSSLSGMLLNLSAGVYGDAAIAAFSCVSRISFFTTAVAIGIGQGFQPISAFNYGAGLKHRVREAFRTALTAQVIILAVLMIPMLMFAEPLIRLMRDDPAVIAIGVRALRLTSVCSLAIPFTMMIEMGFQSIGKKWLAIFGSSLRSGLVLIPVLLLLANVRGLSGIQEAQPLSFVLAGIMALFLFRYYLREMK